VCRDCGFRFVLGGGDSCWRVTPGELLQLLQPDGEEDVPTGIQVAVRRRAIPNGEESDGIAYLDFPDLACPCCHRPGALVQSLEERQLCPACHRGTIIVAGSCIY
jgi:hypothetical protein